MIGGHAGLHVLRARVHGTRADPFRTRLAVERMLANVDAGQVIGQTAILVARRAKLHLTTPCRAIQPPVATMLAGLVSRSCRPIHGFVPADAEAVLFADDVELLVCLARASLSGTLAGQWWWDSLLAARYGADAVLAAWLGQVTAIAPALNALDREGLAAAFVLRLGEAAAARLQQALVDVHGLRPPANDPEDGTADPRPSADGEDRQGHVLAPPWEPLGLDARTLALPPSLQTVIGLAASLCRAPERTRSPAFRRALLVWQAADSGRMTRLAVRSGDADSQSTAIDSDHGGALTDSHAPDGVPRLVTQRTKDRFATINYRAAVQGEAEMRLADVDSVSVPTTAVAEPAERNAPGTETTSWPERPVPAATVSPGETVVLETRFGGILFLLNVGLALELWGDFTAPRHQGEGMTPWEWLAAMGERLCGLRLRTDPLWDLLRQLSGGEGTEFPSRGSDDEEWRIPPPWLAPFGPMEELRVFVSAGRLRIEHPAGFPLLDQHPHRRGIRLEAMARYLRARLCLALHAPRFREAGAILLRHHARLVLTASRLDATFALSRHPVAVRIAGLDRDPGWIAAAGRDIRLHFQ